MTGRRGPFPNYATRHVFECPKGHWFECGDAQHHRDKDTLLCCHDGCREPIAKLSCPPGCPEATTICVEDRSLRADLAAMTRGNMKPTIEQLRAGLDAIETDNEEWRTAMRAVLDVAGACLIEKSLVACPLCRENDVDECDEDCVLRAFAAAIRPSAGENEGT